MRETKTDRTDIDLLGPTVNAYASIYRPDEEHKKLLKQANPIVNKSTSVTQKTADERLFDVTIDGVVIKARRHRVHNTQDSSCVFHALMQSMCDRSFGGNAFRILLMAIKPDTDLMTLHEGVLYSKNNALMQLVANMTGRRIIQYYYEASENRAVPIHKQFPHLVNVHEISPAVDKGYCWLGKDADIFLLYTPGHAQVFEPQKRPVPKIQVAQQAFDLAFKNLRDNNFFTVGELADTSVVYKAAKEKIFLSSTLMYFHFSCYVYSVAHALKLATSKVGVVNLVNSIKQHADDGNPLAAECFSRYLQIFHYYLDHVESLVGTNTRLLSESVLSIIRSMLTFSGDPGSRPWFNLFKKIDADGRFAAIQQRLAVSNKSKIADELSILKEEIVDLIAASNQRPSEPTVAIRENFAILNKLIQMRRLGFTVADQIQQLTTDDGESILVTIIESENIALTLLLIKFHVNFLGQATCITDESTREDCLLSTATETFRGAILAEILPLCIAYCNHVNTENIYIAEFYLDSLEAYFSLCDSPFEKEGIIHQLNISALEKLGDVPDHIKIRFRAFQVMFKSIASEVRRQTREIRSKQLVDLVYAVNHETLDSVDQTANFDAIKDLLDDCDQYGMLSLMDELKTDDGKHLLLDCAQAHNQGLFALLLAYDINVFIGGLMDDLPPEWHALALEQVERQCLDTTKQGPVNSEAQLARLSAYLKRDTRLGITQKTQLCARITSQLEALDSWNATAVGVLEEFKVSIEQLVDVEATAHIAEIIRIVSTLIHSDSHEHIKELGEIREHLAILRDIDRLDQLRSILHRNTPTVFDEAMAFRAKFLDELLFDYDDAAELPVASTAPDIHTQPTLKQQRMLRQCRYPLTCFIGSALPLLVEHKSFLKWVVYNVVTMLATMNIFTVSQLVEGFSPENLYKFIIKAASELPGSYVMTGEEMALIPEMLRNAYLPIENRSAIPPIERLYTYNHTLNDGDSRDDDGDSKADELTQCTQMRTKKQQDRCKRIIPGMDTLCLQIFDNRGSVVSDVDESESGTDTDTDCDVFGAPSVAAAPGAESYLPSSKC